MATRCLFDLRIMLRSSKPMRESAAVWVQSHERR